MSHYHINAHIGHCSTSHSRRRLSADSRSSEIRFLILRQAAAQGGEATPDNQSLSGRERAAREPQARLGRLAARNDRRALTNPSEEFAEHIRDS